jgi:ankyrin repeat protein
MLRRFASLSLVICASLSLFGCATLFSSEHRTEDYTPLFAAASAGDVPTVKTALDKNPCVLTATEWDSATLLHVAVQQNHDSLVQLLVADGADVNALTDDHLTPLHMAAQNGNIAIARFLLEHRAKINPLDSKGWTPLDRAEKWNHPLTAKFLERSGGKSGA